MVRLFSVRGYNWDFDSLDYFSIFIFSIYINIMSYIETGEIIYIDSDKREDLASPTEDFTFKIQIPTNKGYDTVCVMSATVKKSWWLVQSGSNSFVLTENGVERTLTVPAGNYSAYSFIVVVPPLLNTASAANGNNWIYSMTLPDLSTEAGTAMFTITVTGNGSNQPSFRFYNPLCYQFGFNNNSTVSFSNSQLISTNCIDFQLDDTIYICSNISMGDGRTDRLQEISTTTSDYSAIVYRCPDVQAYSKPFNTAASNIYNFRLTNHDNAPVKMNGINWLCSILVYRKKK
jgi:hypothetical protein